MTQDRIDPARAAALRQLPSVDQLTRAEPVSDLPHALVVREARRLLEEVRRSVLEQGNGAAVGTEHLARSLRARCESARVPRHRPVINATGVVLHTGLGRAPLAGAARRQMEEAAGYAVVEVDPVTGERDQRELGVAALVQDLLGCDGALVVNNNAAAVTLALAAMAGGREVVVSRGEQVEIGGGFRMPEVMAQAGCRMVEVGTTNRTHRADYERGMSTETACLLKVHPSNFRIEGFHSMPPMAELVDLAEEHGALVLEDLGSGFLLDPATEIPGLEHEPRVQDSLAAGVHVVTFSGDKLLGGPQCGILVGAGALVAHIRSHPLYRAFRCDKLTLAGLEATLRVYRDGEPLGEIPTLQMLASGPAELRERGERLAAALGAGVVASASYAGSGSNPARQLPSYAVALQGGDALCDRLRAAGVFCRIDEGRVLLDQRTLVLEDLDALAARIAPCLGRTPS